MIPVFHESTASHRRGICRRELLRVGGLGLVGLSAVELARWRALADFASTPGAARRRNSCVFIFLFGGPSHIDLWDMKPGAPAEVRGEFGSIATKTPGIHVCEHLPRFAAQMDKICLLRSMTHRMNVHGPACSDIFSGRPYFGPPTTDEASREDWPSLSAMTTRFGQPFGGLPPAVVLPWYLQFPGETHCRPDRRPNGRTFIEDLHRRGLLETTLVVALGEFGRTPKMGQFTQSANTQKTGRDHWPHAFTAILAGGGVRGGQVYGATTSNGGYVADKPVTPADLAATIFYHLGIDHTQHYEDDFQRLRHRLSEGEPVRDLG